MILNKRLAIGICSKSTRVLQGFLAASLAAGLLVSAPSPTVADENDLGGYQEPSSITLTSSRSVLQGDETFTLTATTDHSVTGTGSYLTIYDDTNSLITFCTTGSVCVSNSMGAERTDREFRAYLGSEGFYLGGEIAPTAVSEIVTVDLAPNTLTLVASRSSVALDETSTLTAYAAQAMVGGRKIFVVDETMKQVVRTCGYGNECIYGATVRKAPDRNVFRAYVGTKAEYDTQGDLVITKKGAESESVSVDRTPITVELTTVPSTIETDEYATLTATSSQPMNWSVFKIYIYDRTARRIVCNELNTNVCSGLANTRDAAHHDYVAYVATDIPGNFVIEDAPVDLQAASEVVRVERAEWSVALNSNVTSLTTTDVGNLSATASQPVGGTGKKLVIYDRTKGQIVGVEDSGSTATANVRASDAKTHRYVAYVLEGLGEYPENSQAGFGIPPSSDEPRGLSAISNVVEIDRVDWTVSIDATSTTLPADSGTTLAASTNHPVVGSYRIFIYNRTNQRIIADCGHGVSECSATTSLLGGRANEYVAYVAKDIDGVSYAQWFGSEVIEDKPTSLQAESVLSLTSMPWAVDLTVQEVPGQYGLNSLVTSVTNQQMPDWSTSNVIDQPLQVIFDVTANEPVATCRNQVCIFRESSGSRLGHTFVSKVIANGNINGHVYATSGGFSAPQGDGYVGEKFDPTTANPCADGINVCKAADPVTVQTGELNEDFTDIEVAGALPMNLERSYKGFNNGNSGQFGQGWTWLWDSRLDEVNGVVAISMEDGSEVSFKGNAQDGFKAPSYIQATLRKDGGNWYLTRSKNLTYRFDSTGKLTKVSDRLNNSVAATWSGDHVSVLTDDSGRHINITASAGGKILTATSPRGVEVIYGYAGGNLVTVTFPGEKTMTYEYDTQNRLKVTSNANGGETTNAYDADDRVVSQEDPSGGVTTFAYGDHQTTITHPDGEVEHQTYNNGLVASRTRGAGTSKAATWTFMHDKKTFAVTRAYDPMGRYTQYAYDTHGNKTSETDPLGNKTEWEFDSNRQITSQKSPNGVTTESDYDSRGRLIRISMPFGGSPKTSEFTYGDSQSPNGITKAKDTTGRETLMQYDSHGNRSAVIDGAGNKTTMGYDLDGNQTWTVSAIGNTTGNDPNNYKTAFTFNALNQPMSTTDPLGRTNSVTRDKVGNVLTSTNGAGEVTRTTYDALDRVTKKVDPGGAEMNYTYDAVGNVLTEKDAAGDGMTYEYDVLGNVIKSTDALGKDTTYRYDQASFLTSSKAPKGGQTTIVRDDLGRAVSTTNPVGGTSYNEYNSMGQVAKTIDPLGNETSMTYDVLGNLTKTVRADQTQIENNYDSEGRLLSATNANGQDRTYTYDSAGRRTSVADAQGRTTVFALNPNGKVANIDLPGDDAVGLSYDRAGQNTAKDYSDNTPDVTYSYDAAGRRTGMVDGTGSTTLEYSLGRLDSVSNGNGQEVSYSYNSLGGVASVTYPNGETVERGYDDAGRLNSVTDWNDEETAFDYDDNGNLKSIDYPNGVKQTMGFDAADAMTANTVKKGESSLASLTYTRAADSKVVGDTDTIGTQDQAYGYDTLNRLQSLTSGASGYALDGAGNVTTLSNGSTLQYDSTDRLTSLTTVGSAEMLFEYNATGARTEAVTGTDAVDYGYDAESRMTSFDDGISSFDYEYDGNGLRSASSDGSTDSEYAWDALNTNEELLTDGKHAFIYGPGGMLIEQVDLTTGETLFAHSDQIGSIRMTTDEDGATHGTASFDPYGVPQGANTTGTKFGFTGEYTDDSGLIYLRARYYDPNTAQFLTVDPLVDSTGETYQYAAGNPMSFTDPSGLWGVPGMGAVKAIGGGVISGAQNVGGFAKDHSTAIITTVAVVGTGACIVATAGICAAGLPMLATMTAIGAGSNALIYGLSDCPTLSGFAKNMVIGGALNAIGGGAAKVAGGTAVRAVKATTAKRAGAPKVAKVCSVKPNSFAAATPVLMAGGLRKPIEDVEVGDEVMTSDPETGETGLREVTDLIRHDGDHDMVDVSLSNGETIESTDEHPFWVGSLGQWVHAEDLETGYEVETAAGTTLSVTSIKAYSEDQWAYNFTVEDLHTYYVGSSDVLVHNSGCDEFADDFVAKNGGSKHTFGHPFNQPGERPRIMPQYKLAEKQGVFEDWGHHTIAVKDGKVFDQFTGPNGMPAADWKKTWPDMLPDEFGF